LGHRNRSDLRGFGAANDLDGKSDDGVRAAIAGREHKNMTPDELKSARESYAYIPARLIPVSDGGSAKLTWKSLKLDMDVPHDWAMGGPEIRQKYSSLKLDMFHHGLLNSERDDELMHGLLSVVFWGFASGTNGRVHAMFALSKSRVILYGRKNVSPQKAEQIIEHLRKARELLRTSRIADALQEAQEMNFLGMSFASKVLTFMNPNIAAVYDAVISDRLKTHSSSDLKSLFVPTKRTISKKGRMYQGITYERWCQWCLKKAEALNASRIKWTDWDKDECNWRAVDVERAFFALG
jgi:hypothetical protein